MYVYHNIETDQMMSVSDTYLRQAIIQRMKKRFQTYGYDEILTSVFEQYDLYAKMNGTVNHKQMIKTIDNTGEVLVLRPDVTIPLTQQLAKHNREITEHIRYFYVLDVFRQEQETNKYRESTQAGVEFFGSDRPEADAEVIALAIDLLRDARVHTFTIELGHAGFFKGLIQRLRTDSDALEELTQLIQAKNVPEIEQFLRTETIEEHIKEIITALPFLYGNPEEVLQKAEALPLPEELQQTLTNIKAIYSLLQAYGVAEHVVLDFSLINHMDYYSDIIFQGFIDRVGKPILMGGRYDTLANQFSAHIPAIGFACDIDFLIAGIDAKYIPEKAMLDVYITYEADAVKDGLQLARALRHENLSVIAGEQRDEEKDAYAYVTCKDGTFTVQTTKQKTCSSIEQVVQLLKRSKEFN